jgi:hypothetical protein
MASTVSKMSVHMGTGKLEWKGQKGTLSLVLPYKDSSVSFRGFSR